MRKSEDGGQKQSTALGRELAELFSRTEKERSEIEQRWLEDLRQYKGVYSADIASRLHPERSKAFLRLTRTKVRALDARVIDLLFPVSGEANWALEPTPVPELTADATEKTRREFASEIGRAPLEDELKAALFREVRRSSAAMSETVADQLVEAEYERVARNVIHSGHLYGTGILKGPLVEDRPRLSWTLQGGEKNRWALSRSHAMRPYMEFVPVWDVYPDMKADGPQDASFIFQRHVMDKNELLVLAERSDFHGKAIRQCLAESNAARTEWKYHEAEISSMAGTDLGQAAKDGEQGLEVLEYWGFAEGRLLAKAGLDIESDDLDRDLACNVWLLGETIIKVVLMPLLSLSWPYFFYYFEKDETSIFGEGLAGVMRDLQQLLNASVRAMLDNAAISAGPQIEVNQDLLLDGEDPSDVHPFRIWLRRGAGLDSQNPRRAHPGNRRALRRGAGLDSQNPAIRVTTLPSHTQEFMAMAEMFERLIGDTTAVPGPLQWDQAKGAAATVRGLSMLLNQAGTTLKDHIRLYDEGITKPFITALYHWNMLFNPRSDIKGDLKVRARGLSSLMAKELYVEQLDMFAAATANSLDAGYINRAELLRRMARARDLGPGIVKTDEELLAESTGTGQKE